MIKITQAVIVEGKYDKIKLTSLIDAYIIETGGFAIFKDEQKLALLRALAKRTGILILTDSDRAGFQIRAFLKGAITQGQVLHAYIPDVLGKERRKAVPSKEGKLGVEGIASQGLLDVLRKAGVCADAAQDDAPPVPRPLVTKLHLYEDGLTGAPDSSDLRRELLKELDLPERLGANALVEAINAFYTPEQYRKAVARVRETISHKEGRNG